MTNQDTSETSAVGADVPDMDKDVIMGFKKITPENFTLSDLSRAFGLRDHGQWIAWFNEITMEPCVPEPVRRLFELARGSMIYGWLYYPLVSVGIEQCGRCLEAGVRHAVTVYLGLAPPAQHKPRYADLINDLIAAGLIPASQQEHWAAARKLRNAAAHPTAPTISPPAHARGHLQRTAERLNTLFAQPLPAEAAPNHGQST